MAARDFTDLIKGSGQTQLGEPPEWPWYEDDCALDNVGSMLEVALRCQQKSELPAMDNGSWQVAMKERLGHSTSSPGLTPAAKKAKCRAVVQDETATHEPHPRTRRIALEFREPRSLANQPLLSTSRQPFPSFSPKDGRAMNGFQRIVEL